jgi:MFS family permease
MSLLTVHRGIGMQPDNKTRPADSTAVASVTAIPAGHTSTFAALRVRNYRLFFAGQVVSNTGTWMQRIAQDWLVLQITDSPLAVGITTALQFLPMLLFGLWGGLLADRYPKRRLLLITQSVMGGLAVILAALTLAGIRAIFNWPGCSVRRWPAC